MGDDELERNSSVFIHGRHSSNLFLRLIHISGAMQNSVYIEIANGRQLVEIFLKRDTCCLFVAKSINALRIGNRARITCFSLGFRRESGEGKAVFRGINCWGLALMGSEWDGEEQGKQSILSFVDLLHSAIPYLTFVKHECLPYCTRGTDTSGQDIATPTLQHTQDLTNTPSSSTFLTLSTKTAPFPGGALTNTTPS